MSLNNPSSGFFSTPEFQASGLPWVVTAATSTTVVAKYSLPKVSKSITITNTDATLGNRIRIGFTENGVNGTNYVLVNGGQTVTLDARVKQFFIRANTSGAFTYSVYCALTTIDEKFMPLLTGSIDGTSYWDGVG
jgi:hypothetical protein